MYLTTSTIGTCCSTKTRYAIKSLSPGRLSSSRISGFKITQKTVKEETIPFIEPRNIVDEEINMKELSSNNVILNLNNKAPQEDKYPARKSTNMNKAREGRNLNDKFIEEEMFLMNRLKEINKKISKMEILQEEMSDNLGRKQKGRYNTEPSAVAPAPSVPSPAPLKQTKVYSGVPSHEDEDKPYRKPMKRPSPSDFVPRHTPSAAPEKIMKGSYFGSESPARFPRASRERMHEQEGPDQRKMIKRGEKSRSYGSKIKTSRSTIDIKVNYN